MSVGPGGTPEPLDQTAAGEPADAREAAPRRRSRPVLVELASALLIVGGAMNLLLSIQTILFLAGEGAGYGALSLVAIVLGIVTLALGLAVRYGRAWLIAVNVVAVLAFLELISGSAIGLLFGIVDTVVVLALLRERDWFRNPEPFGESDLRSYGG